jgi:hypothetical protein
LDLSVYAINSQIIFRTPYVLYGKNLHIFKSEQVGSNLLY